MKFLFQISQEISMDYSDDSEDDERRGGDCVSNLFKEDYTQLTLKPDAQARPLWVCYDGRIILEAFNPLQSQAQDFLITISSSVC